MTDEIERSGDTGASLPVHLKHVILGAPGVRHVRDFIDQPPRTGWKTWGIVLIAVAALMLMSYWHGQRTMGAEFNAKAILAKRAAIAKREAELANGELELERARAALAAERMADNTADEKSTKLIKNLEGTCFTADDIERIRR